MNVVAVAAAAASFPPAGAARAAVYVASVAPQCGPPAPPNGGSTPGRDPSITRRTPKEQHHGIGPRSRADRGEGGPGLPVARDRSCARAGARLARKAGALA